MTGLSGILLAGGASRRFGRPKLLEPVAGSPLFHLPLRALLATCEDVVIVLAPGAPAPPLPEGAARVSLARDPAAYEGPLAGTAAGLASVRGERAVVVGGDMPGVSSGVIIRMAQEPPVDGRDAVLLADAEGPRPLPAVVRVAPARELARTLLEGGERRLRALVLGLGPVILDQAAWRAVDARGAWRQDVNVPADLERERP